MPIPVYTKIFSAKENDFVGEDEETLNALEFLSLDLMLTVAVGYIGFISEKADERIAVMQLVEQSKRIYGVNKFALYAIAYGLFVVFSKCKQGISDMLKKKQNLCSYSCFRMWGLAAAEKMGKLKSIVLLTY